MRTLKVAILGAGNGAHAIAGHLGLKAVPVRLYNKFEEEIVAIQKQGGVTVEGVVEGFGPVELVTSDPALVVGWADLIMVVVPAFAHRVMAETCAPHLHDGQIVVLNPGRTGGALEFANVLRDKGVRAQVRVAEAQSLVYACRLSGPAQVQIKGIKHQVPLAAFPATDNIRNVGILYGKCIHICRNDKIFPCIKHYLGKNEINTISELPVGQID